ncbi:glutamyl-tRNA reductase [Cenarchaeum symbiosum A]|uniref:Glutamyl-tRNA reductase n=1 Tax=Cenarchaeum symbiosum (strain A) TaxID=414004 RepID=A0RY58_CENSY|nr:glutamyl-tRNA reductase [Cenarchaeum symbiosum A]
MAENNFDIICARITYKTVPLYKLARFSFKDVPAALAEFKKIPGISEVLILQTGSRVEVFMVVPRESDAPDVRSSAGQGLTIKQIEDIWIGLTEPDQYDLDHFDQTLGVYRNAEACVHLLRLAAGLESVVVGKSEIHDEIRSAEAAAKEAGASGEVLGLLFDTALRIGSRIRESTGIGEDIQTIGDIAVRMAEEGAGMAGKKILLMGTGSTAALVAKAMEAGGHAFEVTSKEAVRAEGFSSILGGTPVGFTDVMADFGRFDIVFVATTADYHVLTESVIGRGMKDKKTGTMILDISQPRAVNEDISGLPGVKLMFRDHIAEHEMEGLRARMAKMPAADAMVAKEAPVLGAMMAMHRG